MRNKLFVNCMLHLCMGHEMTHFCRYFQCPCRSDRPLSNTGHQQRHSQTLDTIFLNVFPKKLSQNSFYLPFHHYFSISWLHYWEIIINNQFETPSPFDTNSKLKCTKSTEKNRNMTFFRIFSTRFEVLFWGVRDLKRLQFLTVDHPRWNKLIILDRE